MAAKDFIFNLATPAISDYAPSLHWDASKITGFNDNDLITGAAMIDQSGNGRNGTATGNVIYQENRQNGLSAVLDDTQAGAFINTSYSFDGLSQASVMFVAQKSINPTNAYVFSMSDTSLSNAVDIEYRSTNELFLRVRLTSGGLQSFNYTIDIPDEAVVIVTYDFTKATNQIELFVNGESKGTSTHSGGIDTLDCDFNVTSFGRFNNSLSVGLEDADLYEMATFERALNATEVTGIYKIMAAKWQIPTNNLLQTDAFFVQNFDLTITANGDFFVSESDAQHIEHILKADKGQFRQSPLLGFSIDRQQNGAVNTQEIKQEIRKQLIADGFTVRKIAVDGELNINIDAERLLLQNG